MATERVAKELAEFFKFRQIGQVVIGYVDAEGVSGQYGTRYIVMEPVLIRVTPEAAPQQFGSVALGLSADLLSKINPKKDIGRCLSIEYVKDEPSPKGNPKRIFKVLELTAQEFTALGNRSVPDNMRNVYRSDRDEIAEMGGDGKVNDDDDDLPF